MKAITALTWMSSLYAPLAWSQCAPGVPSAGNPGCIPPNQSNSPYYQESSSQQQGNQSSEPQAVWADRWGAIAIDQKTGLAGTVEGQESKSQADQTAMSYCNKSGGQNCEVILSFHNQCAAVVLGGGGWGYSGGPTKEVAEQMATHRCGHGDACKVVYSKCSYAERVQ